jgi:hypothetical protein
MEEGSIAVLVDAKEEYTKQLISVLKQCIYQGIKSIYNDSKDICNQDNTPEKVLMVFQDLLSRIPKWSQDIINKEFERIVTVSKCDYIEDLLKVIYISHIKVLTIVHSAQKNKKLSLKVPNGGHFVHLCYIECAREFWKDPYLFSENVNKYELQKNMRDSENMITECIAETIRKQLPVRHILKEFLNEPDEEIEEAEDDVREPVNKKYMKKLETVVKKELKTSGKSSSSNGFTGDIDIDIIRKVIREELNIRPETNVIKKELVDTVVEKIVAAEKEQLEEFHVSDENKQDSNTIKQSSNDEDIVKSPKSTPPTKTNDKDNSKDNNKDNGTVIEEVVVTEITKSKLLDTKLQLESIEIANSTGDHEECDHEEGEDNGTSNLEDLLEDLPVKTVGTSNSNNSKLEQDDIVLDNTTQVTMNEPPAKSILIGNIDEINLDLNELDEDEINLSENELEEVDIKSTKNNKGIEKEVKENKTKDTKYIFFNE